MPLNPAQSKRIGVACAASVAARLPFWVFQLIAILRLHSPLCQWDCKLYSPLSEAYTPGAFFPGFPLILHAVRAVTGLSGESAAIATSELFTFLAGVLILFAGDALWKEGRKVSGFLLESWLLLIAVSIFPSGHFWMRGYSEPILMCGIAGLVILVSQQKWLKAGAIAGLCAVIRPQGVWVAALYAAIFLYENRKKPVRWLGVGALTAAPFAVFLYWLWIKTGDPLYFLKVQKTGWGRHFDLIQGLIDHRPRWDVAVLYLYAALYGAYRFIRRERAEWKFLALSTFALGDFPIFFGGFYSYVRFASVNLGIFVLLAELSRRRPKFTMLWIAWALVRLAIEVYHASLGAWVG